MKWRAYLVGAILMVILVMFASQNKLYQITDAMKISTFVPFSGDIIPEHGQTVATPEHEQTVAPPEHVQTVATPEHVQTVVTPGQNVATDEQIAVTPEQTKVPPGHVVIVSEQTKPVSEHIAKATGQTKVRSEQIAVTLEQIVATPKQTNVTTEQVTLMPERDALSSEPEHIMPSPKHEHIAPAVSRSEHVAPKTVSLFDVQNAAPSPCQSEEYEYPVTKDQIVCTDPALYFHFNGAGFGANMMCVVNSMIYAILNNMTLNFYIDDGRMWGEKHWTSRFVSDAFQAGDCPPLRKTDIHVGGKMEPRIFGEVSGANQRFSTTKDYLGLNYTMSKLDFRRCLLDSIWKLKPEMKETVNTQLKEVKITTPYVGFHVRRGDAGALPDGRQQYPITNFTNAIKDLEFGKDFKGVFIGTDDFEAINELHKAEPDWPVFFCPDTNRTGHDSQYLKVLGTDDVAKFSATALCDIAGLALADYFVGAVESDFARLVQLRRHRNVNTSRLANPARFRPWAAGLL